MKPVLEAVSLSKDYGKRGFRNHVLKGISLKIMPGEFAAIMGPSGSGKTTLLNVISTADKPTSGQVFIDGKDLFSMSNREMSAFRANRIGFIFQDYNLLDTMNLEDNIALPLSLQKTRPKMIEAKTKELSQILGLQDHLKKYPYELSGGQKQRGAAARALITDPMIIFADEPTGALDSKSGRDLMQRLEWLNKEKKNTIIMVTHDALSASYASVVYFLEDGKIRFRLDRGDSQKEFYDKIVQIQASMGESL
ncbi:ABC transporter ATP-binding protein [Ileibacterium valens]|uniref:Bacitracin ABC transporter ATP-binding protein n=1 Tax=Ileibacterium valens TaxID=1862668 RepID=A0A1U7NI57_9FIRM|nr:ABC transporter ATP-binding protein [Ileibacterium valens]OLU36855.1 bacitracin ABC transporter ATP-binding protein [Erysipelotrichaceae bacterium NYU-BL-F16]OLU37553.1 bacitracin ABC transporter ATP-binding protein [Erysipelotrichaceae bacterium NYU-BL-E8]OLU41949.1 bacitracin ABC transporter ATP-binding protein [Ileibacterium valens]